MGHKNIYYCPKCTKYGVQVRLIRVHMPLNHDRTCVLHLNITVIMLKHYILFYFVRWAHKLV